MHHLFTHFSITGKQRNAVVLLCILLVLVEVLVQFYPYFSEEEKSKVEIPEQILALAQEQKAEYSVNKQVVVNKNFNPNDLDLKGFQDLGFSKRQAETILKYRKSLGGNFQSLEQFSKCYAISEKKFKELKPFIQLEINNSNKVENYWADDKKNKVKEQKSLKPFNPNVLDAKAWEALGFSGKQALSILKYKNKVLKGSFKKPEDLQACYVVSDFMYNRLKPYMRIPQTEAHKGGDYNILYINKMNKEDWKKVGLSDAEAENILKFRDFIGGFRPNKTITECKMIDSVKLERIKNNFVLKFDEK